MNLTGDDWEEFRGLFPAADAWITRRMLQREVESLEAESKTQCEHRRAKWIQGRLKELREHFKS